MTPTIITNRKTNDVKISVGAAGGSFIVSFDYIANSLIKLIEFDTSKDQSNV